MESLGRVIDQILARKWPFLVAFFVTFSISYGLLYAVDFLPEPKTGVTSEEVKTDNVENSTTTEEVAENLEKEISTEVSVNSKGLQSGESMPEILTIPSLDRKVKVLNPVSGAVSSLDTALLEGVVRHPDSAALNQEGNLFILGHSSYLPNVMNKNFQALNGIQNLVWGDTIKLESSGIEYVYQVKKVYKTQASDTTVPIAGEGKKLTLATCNSFGSKDDRYIVEAELVETRAVGKPV